MRGGQVHAEDPSPEVAAATHRAACAFAAAAPQAVHAEALTAAARPGANAAPAEVIAACDAARGSEQGSG